MGKEGSNIVEVAVSCGRQSECSKGNIVGDGTCFELEPRRIIVPIELCLEDRVEGLNYEEPLQNCQLGYKRWREVGLTEK